MLCVSLPTITSLAHCYYLSSLAGATDNQIHCSLHCIKLCHTRSRVRVEMSDGHRGEARVGEPSNTFDFTAFPPAEIHYIRLDCYRGTVIVIIVMP